MGANHSMLFYLTHGTGHFLACPQFFVASFATFSDVRL